MTVRLGPNSPLLTKGGRKRSLGPDEASIQSAILEACVGPALPGGPRTLTSGLQAKFPELHLLYAINPNKGGQRSKAARGRAKAMGLLPGMPDLHLPIMRGPFLSLYLEVKRPDGRVQSGQETMRRNLEHMGHLVAVVRSAQQGVDVLVGYLALPMNRPSLRPLGPNTLGVAGQTARLDRWRYECVLLLSPDSY